MAMTTSDPKECERQARINALKECLKEERFLDETDFARLMLDDNVFDGFDEKDVMSRVVQEPDLPLLGVGMYEPPEQGRETSSFGYADANTLLEVSDAPSSPRPPRKRRPFTSERRAKVASVREKSASISPSRQGNSELKRGLSGTIDGFKVSALADTGAAQNVVSRNFAKARGLDVAGLPSSFKQGNSTSAFSLGTVNVRWAFADKPTETIDILCHVISKCVYDVILGSQFLSMTETFTKYKHRLTKCLSSAARVLRFNLLGGSRQLLERTLGHGNRVYAVPDTGADGNVMDLRYAEWQNFNIMRGPENRRVLEFADGSRQETVGQVETSWQFDCGQRINLIFEVLEDCIHDVVLGEEFLWEHDIFVTYAASIQTLTSDTESFDLAPFSFVPKWVQKASEVIKPNENCKGRNTEPTDLYALESEERNRRDFWNHRHNFDWENASDEEKSAERERRRQYEERLASMRLALEDGGSSASRSCARRIPSIPKAPKPLR